ncbi:MAG: hypothetical protein ACLRZH_03750 [Ruthenibacterium lactatiformans]
MAQAIQHLFPDAQFGIGLALTTAGITDIGGTEPLRRTSSSHRG